MKNVLRKPLIWITALAVALVIFAGTMISTQAHYGVQAEYELAHLTPEETVITVGETVTLTGVWSADDYYGDLCDGGVFTLQQWNGCAWDWVCPYQTMNLSKCGEAQTIELDMSCYPSGDYTFRLCKLNKNGCSLDLSNEVVVKVRTQITFGADPAEYGVVNGEYYTNWGEEFKEDLENGALLDGNFVKFTAEPTSAHYQFVNWTGAEDCFGYKACGAYCEFWMPKDRNVDVVAHFEIAPHNYVLYFDANAGDDTVEDMPAINPYRESGVQELSFTFGLPTEAPKRVGYDFLGWATDKEGENPVHNERTLYADLTSESLTTEETLYACWAPIDYTVEAFATPKEGGEVTVDKAVAHIGDKVTLTQKAKDGYKFVKYNVLEGDVEIAEDGTFVMGAQNVRIEAVYEKVAKPKKDEPATPGTGIDATESGFIAGASLLALAVIGAFAVVVKKRSVK